MKIIALFILFYELMTVAMQQSSSAILQLTHIKKDFFPVADKIIDAHFYDDTSLLVTTQESDQAMEATFFYKLPLNGKKEQMIQSIPYTEVKESSANEQTVACLVPQKNALLSLQTFDIEKGNLCTHLSSLSASARKLKISNDGCYVGYVINKNLFYKDLRTKEKLTQQTIPHDANTIADYTLNQLPNRLPSVITLPNSTTFPYADFYSYCDLKQEYLLPLCQGLYSSHDYFNYEGDCIIALEPGQITLWDSLSCTRLLTFFTKKPHYRRPAEEFYCCDKNTTLLISTVREWTSHKSRGHVWDIQSGKPLNTFETELIGPIQCSPNGKKILMKSSAQHSIGDIPSTMERDTVIESFKPYHQQYFQQPLYGNNPATTYEKVMKLWSMRAALDTTSNK